MSYKTIGVISIGKGVKGKIKRKKYNFLET